MLERLTISNIALIKSQTIEFSKGLNVLTGETGAGKSLIVDALTLLLGEKADKSLISKGEKNAFVEAVFSTDNPAIEDVLSMFGVEQDSTIIISRKLSVDGKNECRVNGNSFTLSMLKKLSAPLMDLHGQFEHQNLLKIGKHLEILDCFGGKSISSILDGYRRLYDKYNNTISQLNDFNGDDRERNRLVELYKYQVDEINEANFHDGEEEELKEYRNQVLHQEKIVEAMNNAIKLTSGDGYEYGGVLDSIKKAVVALGSVSAYCNKLEPLIDRLEQARIELDDISSTLDEQLQDLYIDEEQARLNEERLDLLSSLKQKYGANINEINEYRDRTENEYLRLVNAADKIKQLQDEKIKLEGELVKVAEQLTNARKEAAKRFELEIKQELVELGMKSANFVVDFKKLGLDEGTRQGLDRIEFMFCANLGQQPMPLKSVASGGEMSRFMLAVKNVTAKLEGVETLVFDEIDSGVSGHIALALAQKLKKVSKCAQVICVSHLPQIASYGDNHLVISKEEKEGTTITTTTRVTGRTREEEIARLISGNLTEHSIMHAKELLSEGSKF